MDKKSKSSVIRKVRNINGYPGIVWEKKRYCFDPFFYHGGTTDFQAGDTVFVQRMKNSNRVRVMFPGIPVSTEIWAYFVDQPGERRFQKYVKV